VLDSFGFLILQDKMNIVKFQQVNFFGSAQNAVILEA